MPTCLARFLDTGAFRQRLNEAGLPVAGPAIVVSAGVAREEVNQEQFVAVASHEPYWNTDVGL